MKKQHRTYRPNRITSLVALFVLVVAIPFVLYTLFHATAARAEWFNASWGYRQAVRFTNGGSAVTDQKVLIAVDTATQITANKMQSSCQDVRFTDAQGKLLQYYINVSGGAGVGCNDASSDFYVLMPSIVAGDNLIYIYYGNPSALAGTASANFGNTTFSPSVGPTAATQETTPGPVAYWKLDDGQGSTANDASGHGNSLTLTSTAWATASATLSNRTQYLQFNGAISLASRANDVEFDFGTGSFSISTWIRHASAVSNTDTIIARYSTAGWKVYMNSSGYICFGIDDDNTWGPDDSACTTTSYADSLWHHVEVVKSTTTSITVYIDGIQKAQTTSLTATGSLSTTASLYVGTDSTGNTNWWDGSLDDIAIYPYARTIAQVQADATGIQSGTSIGASTKDPLTDGLVGWWRMNEASGNATDASGNNQTLTDTNTVAFVTGKFENGGDFELANSEYQYISDNDTLSVTGSLTLSTWIKPETVSAGTYNIVSKWDGANESYRLVQNGDEIRLELDSSGNYVETSAQNLSASTWYHVVGVYNSNLATAQIFINGVESTISTSGTIPSSIGNDGSRLHIGAEDSTGGATGYYDGIIDDIRIYNRSLSPAEVTKLYNWGPAPLFYFPFDENTGTTSVYDKSGNGYVGTMQGSMTSSNWVQGKYGSALNFDGVDDKVQINYTTDFGTRTFSAAAWIKVKPGATGFGQIIGQDHFSAPSTYWEGIQFGVDQVWLGVDLVRNRTTTSADWLTIDDAVTAGTWTHVMVTYDGTITTNDPIFYVNGIPRTLQTNINGSGSYEITTLNWIIGGRDSGTDPFSGVIDDLKVYNYIRTPSQVLEDMNHGGAAQGEGSSYAYAGRWKFDEGALNTCTGGAADFCDSSRNGNDLTYSTTTGGFTTSGKFGTAFNGTGAVWAIKADTPNFDFLAADDMAISMWFKSDSATNTAAGSNQYLLAKGRITTTGTAGYTLYFDENGKLNFGIKDDADWGASSPGTPAPDDTVTSTNDIYDANWHHVVATKTGTSNIKLYIDGKLESTDSSLAATATLANSIALRFADDDADATNSFAGDIDELRIYRIALTPEQIQAEYTQGFSLSLGALSTDSTGIASNSAERQYCPPGNSEANCAAGLNAGPMAEWHLNEPSWTVNCSTSVAMDTSGNNYHLRSCPSSTGPNGGVTGKLDKAGLFDGSDDYLESTSTNFNLTGAVSMSAWVRPMTTAAGDVYVVNRTNNNAGYSLGWAGAMGVRIQIGNGTAYSTLTGTTAMTLGKWHHIAGTVDASGNAVVYLNGKIDNSGAINILAGSVGQNLRVGSRAAANTVNGYIDEVRIYSYVRTPSQIAWEYNRGAPTHWYKFDECQGATTYNSAVSGSNQAAGYNGTITIGATGSNTSIGTCSSGTSTEAWNNGTTGKRGNSLSFDGTNDYVSVSSPSLPTGDFSYAAWFKVDDLSNDRTIFMTSDGSAASEMILRIVADVNPTNPNKIEFGADDTTAFTTQTVQTGQWYHVAFTRTSGTMRVYLNGKLDATTGSDSSTLNFSTCQFFIGLDVDTSGCAGVLSDYFDGLIDDVRIYNYALTQQQVNMVMNEGGAVRFGP